MSRPNDDGRWARLRSSPLIWALLVGLAGVLVRVLLLYAYEPISYGDTPSYLRLAEVLSRLTLEKYDGTRVPGYPAFLALLGMDPGRVWLAQLALGWATSMILYWLTLRTTGSALLGALIAILYNVLPGQLLFEANLLTETLTSTLVATALALLVALDKARRANIDLVLAAALGVVASVAGLVRPLFFLLPVWLTPFVATSGISEWGRRSLRFVVFMIGPILILGGWLSFMRSHYRVWSPTVMGGYHLVQHTGEFFEYLPDEEAVIRDTYLKYRDAQIAERGAQVNAIWDAIPELSQASGLSFYALSRKMQQLSIQLILEHPALYLRNVVEGWIAFWKAPVYWRPDAMSVEFVRLVFSGIAVAGRLMTVAANGLFLLLSALALLSSRARSRLNVDRYALAAGGLVLATSIVQTLADHGDNPRFLVPLQMIVTFTVARAVWHGAKGKESYGQ